MIRYDTNYHLQLKQDFNICVLKKSYLTFKKKGKGKHVYVIFTTQFIIRTII